MEEEETSLSGPMVVIAMVNGMIGGLILILPVMALESGWLLTLIVLIITGFISYYSCDICVLHTGEEPDMDVTMYKHFWNSKWIKMFYQFCIFTSIILICILYYELIVIQWQGLACNNEYSPFNPIINSFVLLAMVFVMKIKEFGPSLMAYGIISIITYLLFLTWAVGSEEASHDDNKIIMFHGDGIDLAAALGQAFAIQAFFIPILKQNKKHHKYRLYTKMAFILGTLAYGYIAFMGSQGIIHRVFRGDPDESKTIEGYFQAGAWQVKAIEIIYLVHLYSVFPQFLLISKKRIFSIFELKQSEQKSINKFEIIYILSVIAFCLGMALLKISLRELVEINGAVIGFFFIYFFPVAIHFKCVFMKPDSIESKPQEEKKEEKYVEMIEQGFNKDNIQKEGEGEAQDRVEGECVTSDDKESYKTVTKKKMQSQQQPGTGQQSQECSKKGVCWALQRTVSPRKKKCELLILAVMLILGLIIMIQGIVEMCKGDVQE